MKRITLDDLLNHFEKFKDDGEKNGVFNLRDEPDGTIKIWEEGTVLGILSGYSKSNFNTLYKNTISKIEQRGWKYEIIPLTAEICDGRNSYTGDSILIGITSKGGAINFQNDSFAKTFKGRK